jgi:hypothetical protein
MHNLLAELYDLPIDGKTKVTISNAGGTIERQRGLDRLWDKDISQAGIGGKYEDTEVNIHLLSKYLFALPIICARPEGHFEEIYEGFKKNHLGDEKALFWFIDTQVSTMDFTKNEMHQYLEAKQRHYIPLGVNLTDPALQGLKGF